MHKPNPFSVIILLIGLLVMLPKAASADMGPKESADFEFITEEGMAPLSIVEGTLLICADKTCQSAAQLIKAGPQHFSCERDKCSSMAYGYGEAMRLSIRFSDGVIRQSNVFEKQFFSAKYKVTMRKQDLVVEEKPGGINPFIPFVAGTIVAVSLFGAVMFMQVLLIAYGWQGKANLEQTRPLFIIAWILSAVVMLGFCYFSWIVPATAMVEGCVAVIFTKMRKRNWLTLLTFVLVANLVTTIPFWYALNTAHNGQIAAAIGIGECIIITVEAALLYLTQHKDVRFSEMLFLSLLLNTISFSIGLLLPFS